MEKVLSIADLKVWFPVRVGFLSALAGKEARFVRALDGISFDVGRGEVFCLVGESGCGKTTTGKAVLRLNQPTSGSILAAVPEQDMHRIETIRTRLAALGPLVAALPPAQRAKADQDFQQLHSYRAQIEAIRNPGASGRLARRRERLKHTIGYLEGRIQELRSGEDAAIRRIMAKDRERIDLLRTLGPRFSPSGAKRLERREAEHKEAKFRVLRAEVTHGKTRKPARRLRAVERRLERTRARIVTGTAEVDARIRGLEAVFETKQREATQAELANVENELAKLRSSLEALPDPQAGLDTGRFRELEKAVAALRAKGGPGLEARELEGQLAELHTRYDLAEWGKKGRRIRRKELARRMRDLRRRMQIIYQDPYESLNPKLSIFDIVAEPLLANKVVATPSEAEAIVAKALEDVGLRPAKEYMLRFPHELSGGQRQRVGIAAALVVDPDFIVADEPVSMLDASVRTEILAVLLELKKRRNLTYLFITHDLGLAWIIADKVAVMYLGKIVEMGDGPEVIQNPRHPYTKALISVVPSPNPNVHREKIILRGERPNPVEIPTGCRFHPRCPLAVGICGWDSEEVRDAVQALLDEDRGTRIEAQVVTDVMTDGPFGLRLMTSDPARVERYLRARIEELAGRRPPLASIRQMKGATGTLALRLHVPAEPSLRAIVPNVSVACHIVEPEFVEAEAVAVAK